VSHGTARYWWNKFGPMFASQIQKRRIEGMKPSRWQWHLDEVEPRIRTCHFDDESGQCSISGGGEVCRNLSLSTPPSSTISVRSGASTRGQISS